MPTSRAVLRAGFAAACLCMLVPTSAEATTGWSAPSYASEVGHTVSSPAIGVTPEGSATVAWSRNDGGDQVVVASTRPVATGAFGPTTQISNDGENAAGISIASDSVGDVTVAWVNASGPVVVKVRTLHADTGAWDPTVTELNDAGHAANGYAMVTNPDGSVTVVWGTYDGQPTLRMQTRPAGGTWGAPRDVQQASGSVDNPRVAFNAAGDGVAVWRSNPGGAWEVRAARYSAADDTWTVETDPVATEADGVENPAAAIDALGNIVATWSTGTNYVLDIHHAEFDAASGTWTSAPEPLETNSDSAFLPNVAATDANYLPSDPAKPKAQFVTTYQAFVWDADIQAAFTTSYPQTRTYDPATKTWGPATMPGGVGHGGAVELHVNARGDMLVSMIGTTDLVNPQVIAAARPRGAAGFDAARVVVNTDFNPWLGGVPHSTIDAAGDGYATFPQTVAGDVRAGFSFGDLTGPELTDIVVPSTGTTGADQSFSASVSDRWSPLDTTTWEFGDGAQATGTTASHSYANAGTYTVTIIAKDAAGNTTRTTRQITIADPPAQPEQQKIEQPIINAPVIEAKLSGKLITLNARVTLRSGKACSGKVAATTRFGTTTYRATLKLATVDGRCIATGVIKLKKSPSVRTKLRVSLSGKSVKARTLTTKRG